MKRPGLRGELHKRLRTLAALECANVLWLPAVVYGLLGVPPTLANVSGTVVALVILVQGAAYWWLKLRQLSETLSRPRGLSAYAVFRRLNWYLLGGSLVPVVVGLLDSPDIGAWPGLAFWLLAVAEQVNYFYLQLMHDTTADLRRLRRHGFRRAHLARDLAQWSHG